MISTISQIYQVLKRYFLLSKNTNSTQVSQNRKSYQLLITLTEKGDTDINFVYPVSPDTEIDQIPEIAEKYASLLVYLESKSFRNRLLKMLKYESKNNPIMTNKLFFDNLLAFYSLIAEQEELHKRSNTEPLIRPRAVFTNR
jgi:hypothetical protein